ncbi:CU044_5270 family protein [Streptomyces sp. NBC_01176]|uniref:CU044_5270 family protein n=1 Tax=Streptomyces sp. NBC_01176 TaxID=2903760 RepID=UPI00386F8297|nr:CU044_5270 family protein [Streptomyces sp. NBC_01176]
MHELAKHTVDAQARACQETQPQIHPMCVRAGQDRRPARVLRRAAIGAVTAAAVTAGVLVASGEEDGPRGTRTDTVAVVLEAAAKNAERGSAQLPGPQQWAYLATVACMPQCFTSERWWQGNGKNSTAGGTDVHGHANPLITRPMLSRLGTPDTIYKALSALPAEPHALLEQLGTDPDLRWALDFEGVPRDATPTLDDEAGMIFRLLQTAPILPPKVNASLFRALKLVPGVRFITGTEDALHRHGLGVQIVSGTSIPVRRTLVLDPRTYAYFGYREQWHGAENFTFVYARKAAGVVDHSGERPH